MQDPQQVIQNLQVLRGMGIELAIDDFGTGQSSLAYLKRLPVHEVKIDRAFVKDIEHNHNDALIVNTTTELAHGLGLLVTAEGLENVAGLTKLQAAGMDAVGLARERALSREIAVWMVEQEVQRRADGRRILVEQEGKLHFTTDRGDFILTAKADRLEVGPGSIGRILDYKTGAPPSTDMVTSGFSPQLTLTGAILSAGGFPGLAPLRPEELSYVRLTGRRPAGEIRSALPDRHNPEEAAAAALEGLIRRIRDFDDPERAYISRTAPSRVKLYDSDYDHLARVREWSSIGDGGDA